MQKLVEAKLTTDHLLLDKIRILGLVVSFSSRKDDVGEIKSALS